MQINRIYCFQNFKVEEESVAYPSGSNNPFQLRSNSNFTYKIVEDQATIPRIAFSFKSVSEILLLKNNTRVGESIIM